MKQLILLTYKKTPFYHMIKDFMHCGMVGWCLEILFTSLDSLRRRQLSLKGFTSLWMFPIYGSIALLKPVFHFLHRLPLLFRGTLYAAFIFLGEYLSGSYLKRHRLCPWDYGRCKWHINGVIRLDFFPFWFLTGLLFEKLLTKR